MSWIVERRCAIAIVVRPAISTRSASRIRSSVSVSTLDVASSSTRTRGSNASARAYDADGLARADLEADVAKHPILRRAFRRGGRGARRLSAGGLSGIRKPHVFEHDATRRRRGPRNGADWRLNDDRLVEQLEDPLG